MEDDAHFHVNSTYKRNENARRINNGKNQLLAPTVGDLFLHTLLLSITVIMKTKNYNANITYKKKPEFILNRAKMTYATL